MLPVKTFKRRTISWEDSGNGKYLSCRLADIANMSLKTGLQQESALIRQPSRNMERILVTGSGTYELAFR